MKTEKILISLPSDLNNRLKAVIPARQRSKIIRHLLEHEISKREEKLYACALAVEEDEQLNREMQDWQVTADDGITDETW